MSKKANFYYRGKFFDTEEEFRKYVKEWPDLPLDIELYERDLMERIREVIINRQMNPDLTNKQAWQILRLATDWVENEKPS